MKQTDVKELLRNITLCENIITTGQKATDIIVDIFQCEEPKVGEKSEIIFEDRRISFWRMPSSSRAYPMSLENKSVFYRYVFAAYL